MDDPGGGIDDPGGGDIDDLGSLDNLATSTTTSSKTSVSFVPSSLTTGFSLLSLSDKSAVDVVGNLDVDDCATGSFCSSCVLYPTRKRRPSCNFDSISSLSQRERKSSQPTSSDN